MQIRYSNSSLVISVLTVLVASAAGAAGTYSMTGKAAIAAGAFVKQPAIGNVACPSIVGKVGFAPVAMQTMTQPASKLFPAVAAPNGCIPGGPAKVVTNATGGFTVPANFFKQPFPGGSMGGTAMNLNVVPVPNVPQIIQLATSFQFTGPPAVPAAPLSPILMSKAYAPWRKMRHTAWMSQTGRAGLNFTACGGTAMNLACTVPSQGAIPAIIKNIGGPGGGFGGTMAIVLNSSPTQDSSLVIKVGAAQTILVNIVAGKASRPGGRGYAAYNNNYLKAGPLFLMYALTTMKTPKYALVKSVMTPIGLGPKGTNKNWGFPFTTGQIVVRGTGSTSKKGVNAVTLTEKGFDTMTAMGQRNIQLVAGALSQSNIQGPNGTPDYTVLRLPEPSRALQLFAGVAGLLAVALFRGRRAR
jgi:hypothetical protein